MLTLLLAAACLADPLDAAKLHADCLVADGHNDLPWEMRSEKKDSFAKYDLRHPQPQFHTDLPRLRQGNVGWQFWSAYVPSSLAGKGTASRTTFEQIDMIHRMVAEYPEALAFADSADEVLAVRKAGKIACMIGIEGGHSIENNLALLRTYRRLGVRYMTLTHSDSTDWADSCSDVRKSGGLSPFGEEVVREMNRIGMLVDISHVSPECMKAALRVSKAPVIASHSSAFAVCPTPRNVPDDVLKLVAKNRGVVMANFYSGFVVPEAAAISNRYFDTVRELQRRHPKVEDFRVAMKLWKQEHPLPRGTVATVADHLDHLRKVAGPDCVGLGGDFDGVGTLPVGLEDVSKYPAITAELVRRGWPETDIRKALGLNILRVLRAADAVARPK